MYSNSLVLPDMLPETIFIMISWQYKDIEENVSLSMNLKSNTLEVIIGESNFSLENGLFPNPFVLSKPFDKQFQSSYSNMY